MADWYEIEFKITEDSFLLEVKTLEMSIQLAEAQRELFLSIVEVNHNLERAKFSCDCKKSLIPEKTVKEQIDRLNSSFDKFEKVMVEHGISSVHTDDWVTETSEKEFLLKGGAVFSPRFSPNPCFLDKAVGD